MTYLRPDDLTDLLSVTRRTIRRWTAENDFPQPIKLSAKHFVWRSEQIDKWLADKATAGTPKQETPNV